MKKKNVIIIAIIALLLIVVLGVWFFTRENTLIFNEAGTYDYAAKGTIKNDVHVESTDVVLKNIVLENDLYIDETVGDGHVELQNVEVKGTLYVYGGGLETILIQDGKIYQLIGYVDGRIKAEDETIIDEIIVREPGMVLENDETALEAFPKVNIDIEEPTLEDEPVVLNGSFDEVEVQAGANVEVAEQTRIRYFPLCTCSKEECPENYKTRVRVRKEATIEQMNVDNPVEIDNEGNIVEQKLGKNIAETGEEITEPGNANYKPQVTNKVTLSVTSRGDYTMNFKTNVDGTIHYIVQPYYNSAGVSVSKDDILAKKGYDFTKLFPGDEVPPMQDPFHYVVSAKSITVTNKAGTAKGYMGDIMGQRPPVDSNIEFMSVVWYVFEDSDGNFGDVEKIIYK